jgi:hypothetical protein
MSDNLKLGQIIKDPNAARDAIHIAVAPAVAGEDLVVGGHVRINGDTAAYGEPSVGIVDPYLTEDVRKGQRFWLFLYPQTVTSLRHAWTHPAFASESLPLSGVALSESWLRMYAARVKPYEEPEEAYRNLLDDINRRELYYHGTDLHSRGEVEDKAELCYHAGIVLGRPVSLDGFAFTCSC